MSEQEQTKSSSLAGIGVLSGLLLAYPVSYYFQPGYLRGKLSLTDYVFHINDVLSEGQLMRTVAVTFVLLPVVLGVAGSILDRVLAR